MAKLMERTLDLNIMSATHLKKVKTLGHQTSYVVVYIYSDQKHTSEVDEVGGLSPVWNFKFPLKCEEQILLHHGSYLNIEIYSHGYMSEKPVGNVIVSLRDLAKDPRLYVEPPQSMKFEVCRPSGRAKGNLTLCIKIGALEKRSIEYPVDQHPPRPEPPFVCTKIDNSACSCEMCR